MEPERCPSFANALKAGKPVFTPTTPSIADGLTVPTVGCNAVATALPLIDKMVQVCTFNLLTEGGTYPQLPTQPNFFVHCSN